MDGQPAEGRPHCPPPGPRRSRDQVWPQCCVHAAALPRTSPGAFCVATAGINQLETHSQVAIKCHI